MTYNVTSYGATGNGTTDDREAIQDAIDACGAAGGGVVYFPKGDYLLDSAHPTITTVSLVVNQDNVTLLGEGRRLSILRLGDDLDLEMVAFGDASNLAIKDIGVDGNASNQTGGYSGLYTYDDVTDWLVRDVWVHNTSGYGIGAQHGILRDVNIQDVLIEDTGSDGFDNKNNDVTDLNNRMTNVTVRRAGLNTALTGQACIDLRGVWNLSNIICEDFNNTTARCNAGIRFRVEPTGGMFCTLTNFYIKGTRADGVNGITMSGYQTSISGGQIQSCTNGILFNAVEATVNGVVARDCDQAFYIDTDANNTILSGCVARESSSGFYVKSDGCVIGDLQARGNVHGVHLIGTSQNTVLSGVSTTNSSNNLYVKSGATYVNGGLVT